MIALLLALSLAPAWHSCRVDVAIRASAAAWELDADTMRGIAWVESGWQANAPRYGTREPWGEPPHGRKWRYCGLWQLQGGAPVWADDGPRIPGCLVLVMFPVVAVWYGAAHLAAWKRHCPARYVQAWNRGGRGCKNEGDGFAADVRRAVRVRAWKWREGRRR
jgi:hypothetical protein